MPNNTEYEERFQKIMNILQFCIDNLKGIKLEEQDLDYLNNIALGIIENTAIIVSENDGETWPSEETKEQAEALTKFIGEGISNQNVINKRLEEDTNLAEAIEIIYSFIVKKRKKLKKVKKFN